MSRNEDPMFQRAFVALNYVVGRRHAALLEALATPHADARLLAQRLGHSERSRRAEVLAHELARVARALEARSIK
jgi:hypothetical protein